MRLPYKEDGYSYGRGPGGERVCRGAMHGRGGSDPRAKWPHGVLTIDEARADVTEAEAKAARNPGDSSYADALTEARARLDAIENPYAGRLTLRRVPLRNGYDGGGAYWGARRPGESLWCAWSPGREIVAYVTACGYRAAADAVREDYPAARVFSHGGPIQ